MQPHSGRVAPLRRPRDDANLGARARGWDRDRLVVDPVVAREHHAVAVHDGRIGDRGEPYQGVQRRRERLPDGHFVPHDRTPAADETRLGAEREHGGIARLRQRYRHELELHGSAAFAGLAPLRGLVPLSGLASWDGLAPFGAARRERHDAEVHPRSRPAGGLDDLNVVAHQSVVLGERLRVKPERVPTRPQVRERELAGGVGRDDLAILGPDVDACQAAVRRPLHLTALPIDPHLPDHRSGVHRPGAPHLHPGHGLRRDGLKGAGARAGDRPDLGHGPRRGGERHHVMQRPRRPGCERRHRHENQVIPSHLHGIRADCGPARVAATCGQRVVDPDVGDRHDAGIVHDLGVGDHLTDADLQRFGRQVESQRRGGRSDERQLGGASALRGGVSPGQRGDVGRPHRIPHRAAHLQHEIDDPGIPRREVAQRPAQHRSHRGRGRRSAHVIQACRKRVGEDDIGHRGGAGGVAVAQRELDLLSDRRLRRAHERLSQGERRDEDVRLHGVGKGRVRGSRPHVSRVAAVRHGARRPRIDLGLERHRAPRAAGHDPQGHDHHALSRSDEGAGIVTRGVGQWSTVPAHRSGDVGHTRGDTVRERGAGVRPAAGGGVVEGIGEHVAGDRRQAVHLLGEPDRDRARRYDVEPIRHRAAHRGVEPAGGGHRDRVAHAHAGAARHRDPHEQGGGSAVGQRDRPREQGVAGVQDAVTVPVAILRDRPSAGGDGDHGERIGSVPGVGERVREDSGCARGSAGGSRRLQRHPGHLPDQERHRVGGQGVSRPSQGEGQGRPVGDLGPRLRSLGFQRRCGTQPESKEEGGGPARGRTAAAGAPPPLHCPGPESHGPSSVS